MLIKVHYSQKPICAPVSCCSAVDEAKIVLNVTGSGRSSSLIPLNVLKCMLLRCNKHGLVPPDSVSHFNAFITITLNKLETTKLFLQIKTHLNMLANYGVVEGMSYF